MSRNDQPSLLTVKFSMHPTHGPVCTQKLTKSANGMPVNEDVIEKVTDKHIADYPMEWARFQNSRPTVRPVGMPLDVGLGMEFELISLFLSHGVADVETFATLSDARVQQIMPGNPIAGINLRNRAMLMVQPSKRTPLPIDAAAAQAAEAAAAKARLQSAVNALPLDQADDLETIKRQLAESQRREAEALALINALTPSPSFSTEPETMADEPQDLSGESETEEAAEGSHVRRGPGRPRRQPAAA